MFEELLEKYKIDQNKSKQEIAKDLARERNRKQGILDNANDLERIKSLRNELAELDDAISHFNTVVDFGFTGITRDIESFSGTELTISEPYEREETDEEFVDAPQVNRQAPKSQDEIVAGYEANPPTDPELQYKIGKYYENNKNYLKAVAWLKKAADQEYPEAMLAMLKYYVSTSCYGVELGKKDEAELKAIANKALTILEKTADDLNEKDRDSEEAIAASLRVARVYFSGVDFGPSAYIFRRRLKDFNKAKKYYDYLAEKKNNPEALFACAYILKCGNDIYLDRARNLSKEPSFFDFKEIDKVVELAERAANQGYVRAQYLLGILYLYCGAGDYLDRRANAAKWFLIASENGHDCSEELDECGELYRYKGVVAKYGIDCKDILDFDDPYFRSVVCRDEKMEVWLRQVTEEAKHKAADALKKVKNKKQAEMIAAEDISKKVLITKQITEIDKAIEYFCPEEKVKKGTAQAGGADSNATKDSQPKTPEEEYDIALDYLSSLTEMKKGLALLKELAEKDNVHAMAKLGDMYYHGNRVNKDIDEAAKWTKKAAEKGDVQSQFSLAFMYLKGEGVEPDKEEWARWMKEAALGGEVTAMLNTGHNYLLGKGLYRDDAKGVYWVKKAAENDDPRAMTTLGECYLKGIGVSRDIAQAQTWFEKAVERGDKENAQPFLDQIKRDRNLQDALNHMRRY